jgi:hypothetical protein
MTPDQITLPKLKAFVSDYGEYVEKIESLLKSYFATRQNDLLEAVVEIFYIKLQEFIRYLNSDNVKPGRVLERLMLLEEHLELIEGKVNMAAESFRIMIETRRKSEETAIFLQKEDREVYDLARPLFEARLRHTAPCVYLGFQRKPASVSWRMKFVPHLPDVVFC